jgi:hypothetical protein
VQSAGLDLFDRDFYKFFFGKKFLFDLHDPAPELYAVKFGRQDFFYRLLLLLERWTFRSADGSLATNPTVKQQAVERGGMAPDRVWIVRSVPDLGRFRQVKPDLSVRRAFRYLVGYVGVIAEQDGVDLLVGRWNTSSSGCIESAYMTLAIAITWILAHT